MNSRKVSEVAKIVCEDSSAFTQLGFIKYLTKYVDVSRLVL